ncbi:electron transport complex subunit RsxC [Echinimonas agarilytica]|uniref:Ion-translocating oxidoreductase complex subunit C n=1 Tax=Echinimonas agarilytica TaxID=1215918 RepID=A0AA42B925_9GAMM|nr:electron transport complex subunit RsxC [Echinimonas agarilytica]MCM2680816.1 electron transport complex subunit RsxC [Echinimonas agarilytica]
MINETELLVNGKLWDYPGGVHPQTHKKQSSKLPIQSAWLPEQIIVPVRQHIGQSGMLSVNVGDRVLKGQALTTPSHGMAVPVHAPTSGTIERISKEATNHPSGIAEKSIVITPDGLDEWCELHPLTQAERADNNAVLGAIRHAGIAGLGGAGFPTEIKLSPRAKVKLLLVNGAECEPYITADDTLMQAHANAVIEGCQIMTDLLAQPPVVIAIEDDKPLAIEALKQACAQLDNFKVIAIPTKYPSGGEKQLIQIVTGKEVPTRGLPSDLGIVVQNVGTAFAVQRAVTDGVPLIERVVTITGQRVSTPANHWVLLGTPIDSLLAHHDIDSAQRVIVGGPMMGYELPKAHAPVTKTTNCLIVPGKNELPHPDDEMPCIRCGQCADACPVSLLPQQLHWYSQANDHEKLNEHNLFDCIECGACAYVCPSTIPLVLEYRQSKSQIRSAREEALKSERAKQRFNARNERLEREKQARAEKHRLAAEARLKAAKEREQQATQGATADKADSKSAVVAAALARAKAKKQQVTTTPVDATGGQVVPDNSEVAKEREKRKELARARKAQKAQSGAAKNAPSSANEQSSAVAAAVARAKAKRLAQQQQADGSDVDSVPQNTTAPNDKASAVAAAVARAKAKRLAQQQQTDDSDADSAPQNTPATNDKASAVAAAVARAKAKRLAQQQQTDESDADSAPQNTLATNDKASAVAAAVARAKAKRLAQQQQTDESDADSAPQNTPATNDKAAKVAAAVAKAKAKREQQQKDEDAT